MEFLTRLFKELPHILYRAQYHFVYGIGLVIAIFFTLRWLMRMMKRSEKWSKYLEWMPTSHGATLVYADCIILLFAFSREAWDVFHGQWVLKAYTDYASWILGVITGDLLAYRLIWLDWRDR